MLIIWGHKRTRNRIGYAADFCPVCRTMRRFRITRLGLAFHIYGLSFGSGRFVGHQAQCATCGIDVETDLDQFQKLEKRPGSSIRELAGRTFPNWVDAYEERLALEHKIRNGRAMALDPHIRDALLRDPFGVYLKPVEERLKGETIIDRYVAIAAVSTILIPLGLGAIHAWFLGNEQFEGFLPAAILTSVLVGVTMTLFFLATAGSRYLNKRVLPHIARCLKPLRPTEAELETIIAGLKSKKLQIGKKVKVRKLMDLIHGHVDEYAKEEDLLDSPVLSR